MILSKVLVASFILLLRGLRVKSKKYGSETRIKRHVDYTRNKCSSISSTTTTKGNVPSVVTSVLEVQNGARNSDEGPIISNYNPVDQFSVRDIVSSSNESMKGDVTNNTST